MPDPPHDPVDEAAAFLRGVIGEPPGVAVVLGSGLDAAAEGLDGAVVVACERIPGWPRPTVAGHAGRLEVGRLGPHRAAVLRGRVHLYEGHPPERVVFPARVLSRLGVRIAILTNAVGGLDPALRPGDLLLVRDHLNLQGMKPPACGGGACAERGRGEFPRVAAEVYDPGLRAAAREAAASLGIPLREGVCAAVPGPGYETPAEARRIRFLGADVVGMSTIPEAVVLCGEGVRVVAVSVVTNVHGAAGAGPVEGRGAVSSTPPGAGGLSHGGVLEAGRRAAGALGCLIRGLLGRVAPPGPVPEK